MSAPHSVDKARSAFDSGRTFCVEFRLQQLRALQRMYTENRQALMDALYADLRKSKMESCLTELDFLINDVRYTIDHVYSWVKPERPGKGVVNILDRLKIIREPYGVVLIIGAWNYPLQLSMLPLHGAIAAGNCAIVKPSEVSPACAKLLEVLLPKYLDRDCYQIYMGGVPETTELLKERFDYIFYTGSTAVGKIVHQAANKFLTPVTLELGGKSPVYLDDMNNITTAVTRIMWGKLLNSGQTCVAPDYVLCSKEMQDRFVSKAKEILTRFYGENRRKSPDLCRIVNDAHFKRITNLLKGANIAVGGNTDATERYIEPTIVVDCKPTDPIMQEEIFGPVLPLVTVESYEAAIKFIRSREKPLAFYIFSENKKTIKHMIREVSAGGICVNDTIVHICTDSLPFGGVGMSGMGNYHGKASFDTFTHQKSILMKNLGFMGEKLASKRYPPYTEANLQFLTTALEYRKSISLKYVPHIIAFAVGMGAAYLLNYVCHKTDEF